MQVVKVQSQNQYLDALTVRKEVFVNEQKVPMELEVDELEKEAIHFVVYNNSTPIGAGRLRQIDASTGKIERICILKSERGKGIGKILMEKVEEVAINKGIRTLKLHSQTHAERFYRNLGFKTISEEFIDAGIPHVTMKKLL